MRNVTLLSACVITFAALSAANAQCNRGGGERSGSSSGSVVPTTTAGFNSPLAMLNTPNTSTWTNQYRSQLAAYQNRLAWQQRNMQMMAQRRQAVARQNRPTQNAEVGSLGQQLASQTVDRRKERLRLQNANKAFQLATRAAVRGRTSKAESHYRRVIRILGIDSELGTRASDAMAALSDAAELGGGETTLLASNNVR